MSSALSQGQGAYPFDLLYWNSDSTPCRATTHSICAIAIGTSSPRAKCDRQPALDLGVTIRLQWRRRKTIAPASRVLGSNSRGPVKYVLAGSGICRDVNPPSKPNPYGRRRPLASLDGWLAKAHEHPGSVAGLLGDQGAGRRDRPAPNRRRRLDPIEDARIYVKTRD